MKKQLFLILLFIHFWLVNGQALPAFIAAPFPQSQCNNLAGNYSNQWRPSHGSPNVFDLGCGNKVVRLYSKNENITTRKSEGIFIDLNNIGITLDTSKKYKIIVTYRYSLPNNPNRAVNFDVYFANGLTEKSSNNCDEEKEPSVSDKMKILTFNNGEFLDDTYTCQLKSKEQGQIAPNKSYKYLWIVSNMNTTLNFREYVDIDKVELYYDFSGSNQTCELPSIKNITVSDIKTSSAKISWDPVPGAIQYRIINMSGNSAPIYVTDNFIILNNLTPNTYHNIRVTAMCSTSNLSINQNISFTTLECPTPPNNITVTPYGNWYKLDFVDIPNTTTYKIEWVDLVTNQTGISDVLAQNHIFYYANNPNEFKFRLTSDSNCNWSDWQTVVPNNFDCNLGNLPTNLKVTNDCSCSTPGRFGSFAVFSWTPINNVVSYQVEYQVVSLTNSSQVKTGVFETNNNLTWYQGAQAYDFTGNVIIRFRVRYKCMQNVWSEFTPWSSNFAW